MLSYFHRVAHRPKPINCVADAAVGNSNSDSFRRLDETAITKNHTESDYALLRKAIVADRVGVISNLHCSHRFCETTAVQHDTVEEGATSLREKAVAGRMRFEPTRPFWGLLP